LAVNSSLRACVNGMRLGYVRAIAPFLAAQASICGWAAKTG
jgi:hypothetical protein